MPKPIILAWVFKHRGAQPLEHSEGFSERMVHSLIIAVSRTQRKHKGL